MAMDQNWWTRIYRRIAVWHSEEHNVRPLDRTLATCFPPGLEADPVLRHAAMQPDGDAVFPVLDPPRTWAIFIDEVYAVNAIWHGGDNVEFVAVAGADPFSGGTRIMMLATLMRAPIRDLLTVTPIMMHAIALNWVFVTKLPAMFWKD